MTQVREQNVKWPFYHVSDEREIDSLGEKKKVQYHAHGLLLMTNFMQNDMPN